LSEVIMRKHGSLPTTLWLLLLLSAPALSIAPASAQAAPPITASTAVTTISSPPLAAWYDNLWDKMWTKIYSSLNNRTGMIQWGLLGMLLALWIIWWRK
jgi:hypothetical protein